MAYYYDGITYEVKSDVMEAVRNDLDFSLSDADFDRYLRNCGGVQVNGEYLTSSLALKRSSYSDYRSCRSEFIDAILSEVCECMDVTGFPFRVPFTFNQIEYSE